MKDVGSMQQQIQYGRTENVCGMQHREACVGRRERQSRMFVVQLVPRRQERERREGFTARRLLAKSTHPVIGVTFDAGAAEKS